MCKLLCGTPVDPFVFYPQGENVHVHTESHIRVYIYLTKFCGLSGLSGQPVDF